MSAWQLIADRIYKVQPRFVEEDALRLVEIPKWHSHPHFIMCTLRLTISGMTHKRYTCGRKLLY